VSDNLDTFRTALSIVELVRHNPNQSLTNLSLKIEQMISQERRAAAEAMRERCGSIIKENRYLLAGRARMICDQFDKLPLNTPDDGRG
jgi:hypothetical protein